MQLQLFTGSDSSRQSPAWMQNFCSNTPPSNNNKAVCEAPCNKVRLLGSDTQSGMLGSYGGSTTLLFTALDPVQVSVAPLQRSQRHDGEMGNYSLHGLLATNGDCEGGVPSLVAAKARHCNFKAPAEATFHGGGRCGIIPWFSAACFSS